MGNTRVLKMRLRTKREQEESANTGDGMEEDTKKFAIPHNHIWDWKNHKIPVRKKSSWSSKSEFKRNRKGDWCATEASVIFLSLGSLRCIQCHKTPISVYARECLNRADVLQENRTHKSWSRGFRDIDKCGLSSLLFYYVFCTSSR